MQTAKRRRTTWAIAASAVAHLAVLIVALLQRPTLPSPPEEPAGPPEAIIPILLLPRAPPSAAGGAPQPTALRLHRRAQRPDENPLPVAPLPAEAAAPQPTKAAPQPATGQQASPPAAEPPASDLRLALRHGVAGCANAGASMTRAERERCNEQLGRGVATAPFLPAAIEPRIRGYYDAVALAKQADPPPVPRKPPGSLGMFDTDLRGTGGHPLAIGCRAGANRKALPHALRLGPCFIAPPKGPLTVEADITPP
jgi:hypothetical protein